MKPSQHLSVVLPAYNEVLRIGLALNRVWAYLRERFGAGGFEIIVVDDGSCDDTVTTVERFQDKAPEVNRWSVF